MGLHDEVIRYLVVGTGVTVADGIVYAALSGGLYRLQRVRANLCSTTCGMALGFTLHSMLVFQPGEPLVAWRLAKYIGVVVISVYGVQSLVIYVLAKLWRAPVLVAQKIGRSFDLTQRYSGDFIDRMTGKLAAVLTGVAWNYVWFKWFVYR